MFGIFVPLASSFAVLADIWQGCCACQDFPLHCLASPIAASASEFAACATQKALHFLDRAWEVFGIQWRYFCGTFEFVVFFA